MKRMMATKETAWKRGGETGVLAPGNFSSVNQHHACDKGHIVMNMNGVPHTFQCKNLDITGHLTHTDLGSNVTTPYVGSSIWGFTLDQDREFVAIAQHDGTAFAEVVGENGWNWLTKKKAGTLDYIGRLPGHSEPSMWREIRDYHGRWAVIASEAPGHGVQIFDMRKLLEVRPWWRRHSTETKVFDKDKDCLHLDISPVGQAHNVVAGPPGTNYVMVTGMTPKTKHIADEAAVCRGGLYFIDMTDTNNPKHAGCASEDGYTHDAQCLIYNGPDTQYAGREICYAFNEDALTITDVTDKANVSIISTTSYDGVAYAHQGVVIDETNQDYLLSDDEYDEWDKTGQAADGKPVTFIWDIRSLQAPILTGTYKSSAVSIDHNQYVKNMFSYQSHYSAGIRILDVASIRADPTGAGIQEVAFLDIFPEDDTQVELTDNSWLGTWANYPLFKSGYIVMNTFDRGAFVVKRSQVVDGGHRAEF